MRSLIVFWTSAALAGFSACSLPKGGGIPDSSGKALNDLSIIIVGGDNQYAIVGHDFNGYLVAGIRDAGGNAVPSKSVDWSVVAGDATLLRTSSGSIHMDGTSAVNLKAGTLSGPVVVRATLSGTTKSVLFHLNTISDTASSLSIVSGNNQTGVVAHALAAPFVVIAKDQYGNSVPGLTIDWQVLAQGGSMSPTSSTTFTTGMASSTLTLGTIVGAAQATATIHGTTISVTFNATAIADVPAAITISSGNNQHAPRGTALPSALTVLVQDAYGNNVPGATIDWAATVGGGSFSPTSSSTSAGGLASSSWTLGPARGTNTATATVRGTSLSTTFNATGDPIAFTQSWPFNSAAASTTYTYDSTRIDFTGGIAKLKTVDQLDDDTSSTGFGGGTPVGLVWDSSGSALILGNVGGCDGSTSNCASVAGSALSGSFTSRVIDVGSNGTNAAWQSLSWKTAYPYGKELPGGAASETSTDYPSLSASLMTGNVALWHLNESTAGTVSGGAYDFADSSGNSNHLTTTGGVTFGNTGILSLAPHFDGTGRLGYQNISLPSGSASRTVSVWFKQDSSTNSSLFAQGSTFGTDRVFELSIVGGSLLFTSNTSDTSAVSVPVSTGAWHLATATYDGTSIRLYLDGALAATQSFSLNTTTGGRRIGSGLVYGGFIGTIDEAALWNRTLSSTEVTELYLRGAARMRFQVRSCTLADCSDASFVATSGSTSNYFSELNNSGLTQPLMTFSSLGLTLTNHRYFQYRVIFDAIRSITPSTLALKQVSIGPSHYDASIPTITNILIVDYLTLATFVETMGAGGCAGGMRYALSHDQTNWYYWNGSAWVVSDSTFAKATAASTINGCIPSLPAAAGIGNLYWKVFLKSDSTQGCEIDNLTATGTN